MPDMKRNAQFTWRSAFSSDPGPRRPANEDAWLDAAEIGVWAVADGMGGHDAGQVASRMVIDALGNVRKMATQVGLVEHVKQRLNDINRGLREIGKSQFDGRTIGSTVAVLCAVDRQVVCLWAGDSRIYRMRGGHLIQMTKDHSPLEELIDEGLINRKDAKNHRLSNVITRAIGADDTLDLDSRSGDAQDGDVFLLCTDGLNKVVSDDEIGQTLLAGDCQEIVKALVHLSLVRKVSDNVTVGAVRFDETN
jgi:serine/threonine protein phosphatase PrpC